MSGQIAMVFRAYEKCSGIEFHLCPSADIPPSLAAFLGHLECSFCGRPRVYLLFARIVPPLSLHSFSVTEIQPFPLQEFCPEQALVALEHSLFPRQELIPK